MRGDLGGLPAVTSGSLEIVANLLTPRTRSVEIFLGVALDLRRSASANGDFIPEFLQSVRQFRLIDGSGKLLRSEKAVGTIPIGIAGQSPGTYAWVKLPEIRAVSPP